MDAERTPRHPRGNDSLKLRLQSGHQRFVDKSSRPVVAAKAKAYTMLRPTSCPCFAQTIFTLQKSSPLRNHSNHKRAISGELDWELLKNATLRHAQMIMRKWMLMIQIPVCACVSDGGGGRSDWNEMCPKHVKRRQEVVGCRFLMSAKNTCSWHYKINAEPRIPKLSRISQFGWLPGK